MRRSAPSACRRRRPSRRRRRHRAPYKFRRNSRHAGPCMMAAPSLAASIGFCPPCSTSEPPMNTIGATPIDHAELAERVGDINLGVEVRQLAERALCEHQPRVARDARDARASLRMPRHQDCQQTWKAVLAAFDARRSVRSPRRDAWKRRRSPAARPIADWSWRSLVASAGGAGTSPLRLPVVI